MSPGACVNAIASSADKRSECALSGNAFFKASSTTGTIFSMCARLASSGTTPPYFSCTNWLAIKLEWICPSMITEAAVSSQDDSIAKMVIGFDTPQR